MVEQHSVTSSVEAVRAAERLGYPVVLKGHDPSILHKTENGLVKLLLSDAGQVRAAYEDLAGKLANGDGTRAGITVEPQERGLELVIGVRKDPTFGLVTLAGLGGIHVERLREASVRVGVVDRRRAREMLAETLAGRLLAGVRGGARYDAVAAAEALARLWRLASSLEDVIEVVEVNPLIMREGGGGAVGVDGVLVLAPGAGRREPGPDAVERRGGA